MFQSEAESSRVSFSPQRWEIPLLLEEITCITSKSTTDSRRDITTYQLTALQLSAEPESETSSPSDNADHSPRPLDSTSSESRSKELKVTLERLSSCSELNVNWTVNSEIEGYLGAEKVIDPTCRGSYSLTPGVPLILIQLTKYYQEYQATVSLHCWDVLYLHSLGPCLHTFDLLRLQRCFIASKNRLGGCVRSTWYINTQSI